MMRAIVCSAFSVVALPACVASEVCGERLGGEPQLVSSTLEGERTFVDANEESRVHLRATLRGLSELWPAEHAVRSAGVGILLHLTYVDATETNGAPTQMPRFAVSLVRPDDESGYDVDTPSFPPSAGIPYHLPVFEECYEDGDPNCCEYGSTECSVAVELRYRRLDGEPFPPVRLAWEATASASVDSCPLSGETELSLELEEP